MNRVELVGRITKDPEVKMTTSQTAYCNFTVAVDRKFKDQNGERQADFINCVAWRQTANFIGKYFHKGSMMVVSGRLQSRKWQDREGNNRTSWEVNADNVYFGESRASANSNGGSYSRDEGSYANNNYSNSYSNSGSYDSGRSSAPAPASNTFVELDDGDGELPF